MKAAIISDSHDHHRNVLKAIEVFNHHKVDYILHAGDIVSPFTAQSFANAPSAKFIAVYGNNDGEKLILKSVINDFGGQIHENCYKGKLNGKNIYMTHAPYCLDEVLKSRMYDLVIYGHTHKPDIRHLGNTLIVNPGESTDWFGDQSQVVILNLNNMQYEPVLLI